MRCPLEGPRRKGTASSSEMYTVAPQLASGNINTAPSRIERASSDFSISHSLFVEAGWTIAKVRSRGARVGRRSCGMCGRREVATLARRAREDDSDYEQYRSRGSMLPVRRHPGIAHRCIELQHRVACSGLRAQAARERV